jgi:hypothetical protein
MTSSVDSTSLIELYSLQWSTPAGNSMKTLRVFMIATRRIANGPENMSNYPDPWKPDIAT